MQEKDKLHWHHVVGMTEEEIPQAARDGVQTCALPIFIDMEHPEPKNHPRMSRDARAAQFAPFAALTGYDRTVDESVKEVQEDYLSRR